MNVLHVVGARPNFMKLGPVFGALASRAQVRQRILHTGQHYDAVMSDQLFDELGIPTADVNLGVGSGSHTRQTADIMVGVERVLVEETPDLVVVYGDVNSTVATAMVCAKLLTPLVHVEAGLRSNDRTMPEEVNRIVTDHLSDVLFTPSADGNENLQREGVAPEKVHLVGNVMIDSLVRALPQAVARDPLASAGVVVDSGRYGLVTLHRPSNVDGPAALEAAVRALLEIAENIPLVFPVHPRTRIQLEQAGLDRPGGRLHLINPQGYLDFLSLEHGAAFVITDSGAVQEETTYLGVPCLTYRENTERPITVTVGTNTLVGSDPARLVMEADRLLGGDTKSGQIPPLWDGKTGERMADILVGYAASRAGQA
jgi:UDP-N-acetylglucosamine 2-epimerase (non-hydrolysing)